MSLPTLRRNYLYGSLSREALKISPMDQFALWFDELKSAEVPDWFEINAMTLATATGTGSVSSRIVLLKALEEDGFCFFTNYRSHKAQHLFENPHASLTFFWPMFERQVRVEGLVAKTSSETSDAYFQSRPVLSRLGAIASPQSHPIPDDEPLEKRVHDLQQQYPNDDIPRPEFWGGFRLKPTMIEFWQGKPSRLHDRFRYDRSGDHWTIQRITRPNQPTGYPSLSRNVLPMYKQSLALVVFLLVEVISASTLYGQPSGDASKTTAIRFGEID